MNLLAEMDASSAADPNAFLTAFPQFPILCISSKLSPADAQGLSSEWYHMTAYIATFEPDSYGCPLATLTDAGRHIEVHFDRPIEATQKGLLGFPAGTGNCCRVR